MKTVIATMALSLLGAVSMAKSIDSTVGSRLPSAIDGSAYPQASNRPVSQNSAVSPAKSTDSTIGSRLPSYIDGSAYEQAGARFAGRKSRAEAGAEAASFDRLRAGLLELFGSH